MKYRSLITLFCLFHFSVSGFNDDGRPDCTNPITTNEVDICIALEAEAEQEILEKYLNAARQRFPDNETWIATFNQAQKAWISYRDAYCDSIYEYWIEGSIRGAQYNLCLKKLTKLRVHVIWEDYLTYPDSTPPILPEPQ